MSLYEGLEVETAPIPEISIRSSADPSSTSNSNDVSENKNISKCHADLMYHARSLDIAHHPD